MQTSPHEGERGVAVTRETIFDFDEPVDKPEDVQVEALGAGSSALSIRLHWSPSNTTLTVFYLTDLPADTEIEVSVEPSSPEHLVAAFSLRFQTLSVIPLSGTELCGRVFASELQVVNVTSNGTTTETASLNVPLAGVTVTVDGRTDISAVTDASGNFFFSSFPVGRVFVHINGKTSAQAPPGAFYPNVGKAWVTRAGRLNEIGDVYLPLVKDGTLQPVSKTEETVIKMAPAVLEEFPEFASVSIRVPPDSLYSNDGTRGGKVGIAPVDPNRLPGEPPSVLDFAIVITVQTDGATNFDVPVPACFPNLPTAARPEALAPGAKTALLSFNHDTGKFEVIGPATVTLDGTLACSDPGIGIRAPGWHAVSPNSDADEGPETGNGCRRRRKSAEQRHMLMRRIPSAPDLQECQRVCRLSYEYQVEIAEGTLGIACLSAIGTATGIGTGAGGLIGAVVGAAAGIGTCLFATEIFFAELGKLGLEHTKCVGDCFGNPTIAPPPAPPNSSGGGGGGDGGKCLRALNDNTKFFAIIIDVETSNPRVMTRGATDAKGRLPPLIYPASSEYQVWLYSPNTQGFILSLGKSGSPGGKTLYNEEDFTPVSMSTLQANINSELESVNSSLSRNETFLQGLNSIFTSFGFDSDAEGLSDLAEFVIGTNPNNTDTDGDGVDDLAEVLGGSDPTFDLPLAVGLIDTAAPIGNAIDVCASDNLLAVAASQTGLAVYNIFQGFTPALFIQTAFPRNLPCRFVACGQQMVAGLSDNSVIVVRAPTSPGDPFTQYEMRFSTFGRTITSMAFAGNYIVVGDSSGWLSSFLATGSTSPLVLEAATRTSSSSISDITFVNGELYVLSIGTLFRVQFNAFTGVIGANLRSGSIQVSNDVPIISGTRIFVDFTRVIAAGGFFGFAHPETLSFLENRSRKFGAKHVIALGDDVGIGAISSWNFVILPWDVILVDLGTYQGADLGSFETPGLAIAVASYSGLVYVADYTEGIQVLNPVTADTTGTPPTVTWVGNMASTVIERHPLRLAVNANDNSLVSYVDFFINGELVIRDGNRPFEGYFDVPALDAGSSSTLELQARAVDLGGNAASTATHVVTILPDTQAPFLLSSVPEESGQYTGILTLYLSEQVSSQSLGLEVLPCLEATVAGDACARNLSAPIPGNTALDANNRLLSWTPEQSSSPLPDLPSGFFHVRVS